MDGTKIIKSWGNHVTIPQRSSWVPEKFNVFYFQVKTS